MALANGAEEGHGSPAVKLRHSCPLLQEQTHTPLACPSAQLLGAGRVRERSVRGQGGSPSSFCWEQGSTPVSDGCNCYFTSKNDDSGYSCQEGNFQRKIMNRTTFKRAYIYGDNYDNKFIEKSPLTKTYLVSFILPRLPFFLLSTYLFFGTPFSYKTFTGMYMGKTKERRVFAEECFFKNYLGTTPLGQFLLLGP